MDIEQQQFEKARIFAYLGYTGIFNPVLGIISSAISISILDRLDVSGSDDDVIEEHGRLMQSASNARIVSVIALVVMVIGVIWVISYSVNAVNKSNAATESYNKALQELEDTSSSYYQ